MDDTNVRSRVVVGVDGSPESLEALRWAARAAALRDSTVRALTAWDLLAQHYPDHMHRFSTTYRASDAEAALTSYVEEALGTEAARTVERRVVCDLPARALIEEGADADLLVVGARGVGGFRGLLLGSVSQHCLRHAPCPVAVVRPGTTAAAGERAKPERIVVGVDGSENSVAALRWAVAEAELRGARLVVATAYHVPYVGAEATAFGHLDPRLFETSARETLEATLTRVDTSALGHPVERVTPYGDASGAVLDVAKDADLIVLGSRGRGGFVGLLLGSVTERVAQHATCPVVVVPAGDR